MGGECLDHGAGQGAYDGLALGVVKLELVKEMIGLK
jgi:hypothetical protein